MDNWYDSKEDSKRLDQRAFKNAHAAGRWVFLNKIQAYFAFGEIYLLPHPAV